tara:strand:+ start:306 stop:584 length:279 start_codon:yes stop_codon:yes gene_type:complete
MATTKTTSAKKTSTPTTAALAKQVATLQNQVKALKAEIADLRASAPRTQSAAAAPAPAGADDKTVHDKIGKIVAMLRNRSLIRDADITDAGL